MSLTADPRALVYEPAGIKVQSLNCTPASKLALDFLPAADATSESMLDPNAIRLLTWNIHKEEDDGWEQDLTRLARANDILLLQEVTLRDPVQEVLRIAGMRWILASSFIYEDTDIGVLTATRAVPVANCTQRMVEPLLRIPKSSVITWLPIRNTRQSLAVANVHAINFTLTLESYQTQVQALEDVLANHPGPLIVAGDFNTWSDPREEVVAAMARRLRLTEVAFADDRRAVFFGHRLDHVFVRGLAVVAAVATTVTSSDHNPVEIVLRLGP